MMTSDWGKSTYSTGANECLEVRGGAVHTDVRDSQHPQLGHIVYPPGAWVAFLNSVRNREL